MIESVILSVALYSSYNMIVTREVSTLLTRKKEKKKEVLSRERCERLPSGEQKEGDIDKIRGYIVNIIRLL